MVTWKIPLKFKLLGKEISTLGLEGPNSVPTTELQTVALGSF